MGDGLTGDVERGGDGGPCVAGPIVGELVEWGLGDEGFEALGTTVEKVFVGGGLGEVEEKVISSVAVDDVEGLGLYLDG